MKSLFSFPLLLLLAGCQSGLPFGARHVERLTLSENFDLELIDGTILQQQCELVPAGRAAYSNQQGYHCIEFRTEESTQGLDIAGYMQDNAWELTNPGSSHNWFHWERRSASSNTCERISFSQAGRFEETSNSDAEVYNPVVLIVSYTETSDCMLGE